jgi:hypothetical protein
MHQMNSVSLSVEAVFFIASFNLFVFWHLLSAITMTVIQTLYIVDLQNSLSQVPAVIDCIIFANCCLPFLTGGWWKVEKFDDIHGSVAIELGSMQYLHAEDNGLFTVGPQHSIGLSTTGDCH